MAFGRNTIYNRPLARKSIHEALEEVTDWEIEQGQLIRDQEAYRVEEKGNGLWISRFNEIETEIQLTGKKLKDYRCDCSAFETDEHCLHFAALLGVINVRKQPKVKAPSRPRSEVVSTKRLLNSISDYDLRDFVTNYAKKNTDFAQDLKLRFAQDLPINDRFDQVIRNLLKRSGNQYSPKQAKRITEALQRFERQREQWFAAKAWLDIFELNTTLAARLVVITEKAERIQLDLQAYIRDCIHELNRLLDQSPPPVIIERIEEWANEQLDRGAYGRVDVDGPLIELKVALGEDINTAIATLDERNVTFGISAQRIETQLELLYSIGDTQAAEKLIISNLDKPSLVFAALKNEIAQENYRRAAKLAEAALKDQSTPKIKVQLHTFLLQIASKASRPGLVPTYAPFLIFHHQSLAVVDEHLLDLDDDLIDELYQLLYDELNTSTNTLSKAEPLKAELFLRMQKFDRLEQLLYRADSDQLILDYLPKLVGKLEKDDLQLLLETKVREKLKSSFGKAPANYVATLLDAIARRSRVDATSTIANRLRKEFKQRHALMDALDQALL